MRYAIQFSKNYEGNRKAPSLSMPKSKGVDNREFLIFYIKSVLTLISSDI